MMKSKHIVQAYDQDLETLSDITLKMLEQTQKMLEESIDALESKNSQKAKDVIPKDDSVDALELSGEELAVKMIATRQPMGEDLRIIISAIKVNSDIERVADYASNIAKRTLSMLKEEVITKKGNDCLDKCLEGIIIMARILVTMGQNVHKLIEEPSIEKALTLWKSDATINSSYVDNFRYISQCMQENTQNATSCTHFIFIAKEMERIGDHFKNIAEAAYYRIEGVPFNKDIFK